MLGPVANVHHPAPFKMAVADVEIAVVTIDADATAPELTAVEREIVIVELQESDAPFAILEQAILEGGLGQRAAVHVDGDVDAGGAGLDDAGLHPHQVADGEDYHLGTMARQHLGQAPQKV